MADTGFIQGSTYLYRFLFVKTCPLFSKLIYSSRSPMKQNPRRSCEIANSFLMGLLLLKSLNVSKYWKYVELFRKKEEEEEKEDNLL